MTEKWTRRTWRWFADHVTYLLRTDTAVAAVFRPEPTPEPMEAPDV